MDHNDWVAATGSPIVGAGAYFRRPVNPKLLAAALGKSAPARHASTTAKEAAARARRRLVAAAALRGQTPAPARTEAQRRRAYERALLGGGPPAPRMKLSAAARGTSFALDLTSRQRQAILRRHWGH